MDDLIYRKAAKEAIHDKIVSASTVVRMWNILDSVPAVDAAPVVHGRWNVILNPFWDAECRECGYTKKNSWEWRFCPNCGAKMDGERRDDDA